MKLVMAFVAAVLLLSSCKMLDLDRNITEAKQADTRAGRVTQTIAYLKAGRKQR